MIEIVPIERCVLRPAEQQRFHPLRGQASHPCNLERRLRQRDPVLAAAPLLDQAHDVERHVLVDPGVDSGVRLAQSAPDDPAVQNLIAGQIKPCGFHQLSERAGDHEPHSGTDNLRVLPIKLQGLGKPGEAALQRRRRGIRLRLPQRVENRPESLSNLRVHRLALVENLAEVDVEPGSDSE